VTEVDPPRPWSRYPRLWLRLLRLCHRQEPGTTAVALLTRVASLALFPATALALRWAVDTSARAATGQATVTAAVLTAAGVAVAFLVAYVMDEISFGASTHLTD
jgi:hypothetical protein